jgi:glycosyltransferase involved in cell wall biosynthesis
VKIIRGATFIRNSANYKAPDPELISRFRNNSSFLVGYAGNMGFAGAWETLTDAVRKLNSEVFEFAFIGEGPQKRNLMELLGNKRNVRFFPYQPEENLLSVLHAPDVHLVTLKKGLEGLVVPSKLYPIMAVGKPIIALVPEKSDAARLVNDAGCGIVVDSEDVPGFIEAVIYMRENREKRMDFARKAKLFSTCFDENEGFAEFKNTVSSLLC